MIITCSQCGKNADKPAGGVNRARAKGALVYCGRECAGIARRDHRSPQQRKDAKANYDARRRAELGEALLAEKRAAYHASIAADEALVRSRQRDQRQARKQQHLEYCRTPEYRTWKRRYDRKHRAIKEYGAFAGAALTLQALQEEINSRSTWLERQAAKGTLNKPQQRKREYGKRSIQETVRGQSEERAVGHVAVDPEGTASAGRG